MLSRRLVGLASILALSLGMAAGCDLFRSVPPLDTGDDSEVDAEIPIEATAATDAPTAVCDAGTDPCGCLPEVRSVNCGLGDQSVLGLGVAGANLYWTVSNGQATPLCFARIDADSGGGELNPRSLQSYYGDSFALDSQRLYTGSTNSAQDGSAIEWAPLDDASVPFGPLLATPTRWIVNLRATPAGLYWIDDNSDICTCSLSGGARPGDSGCGGGVLLAGPPADAGPPANTNPATLDQLAVTASFAFQSRYETGELVQFSLDGGGLTLVASAPPGTGQPVVASDTDVVWGNPLTHTINRLFLADGSRSILTDAAATPGLAMDDASVYFAALTADAGLYRIMKVPVAGGAPRILACAPEKIDFKPDFIVVDDQNVYWASRQDQNIYIVPK